MATGRQRVVRIQPAKEVGNVEVVCPISFNVIFASDTPANISLSLQASPYNVPKGLADNAVQRGREVRGIELPVIGGAVWDDAAAI